jgi:TP901 family phage tail tape measure protein
MSTSSGITYQADVTDVLNKAAQFIKALNDQGVAIKELQIKQLEFNESNRAAKAVLQGVTENNEKVTIGLKKQKGAWEEQKTVVQNATKAQEDASKKASAAATKAEKENAARLKSVMAAEKAIEKQAIAQKKLEDSLNAPQSKKTLLTFSDVARILEATLIKQVFNSVTDSIRSSISAAQDFQIQLSLIRTVSQDQQLSFGSWADGLVNVSNRTGLALADISKTAYDAIQSQVVFGAQAIQFTETAANLARTTGVTAAKAGDLLSSVIQGFKQSVAEADNTAAVLFKIVELGRIRLEELSNTMGRIAPSANTVGIKFEEVGAALATLTRQGIKTSDATTLLTNIVLKLAKPTEAMQRLLRSWGFETAQAAVKTLGFVEVLRRLERTSDGQLNELAQYFNELRGLRGAVGLTSAFKDFESDLQKINEASATYTDAQKIRAESSADTLTKFTNAAKNTFINDFGNVVINVLGDFAEALGKGNEASRMFANGVLTIAAAAVVGKTAMFAFSVSTGILSTRYLESAAASYAASVAEQARTAALAQGVSATHAATAAEIARKGALASYVPTQLEANAAMKSAIGQLGLVAVAVGAAYAGWKLYNSEITNTVKNLDNLKRVSDSVTRTTKDQADTTAQKSIDRFEKQVRATLQLPLAISAEAFKKAEEQITVLGEKSKKTAQDFTVSYQLYTKSARDRLGDANKEATKLQGNLRKSIDAINDFGASLDDIIRKEQLSYATDQQKTVLLKNEIARLTSEAEAAYSNAQETGDQDQLAFGRERLKEVAQILTELNRIENDLNKQGFEQYLQANPSAAQYGTTFYATTVPLQQRFNALKEKQMTLEKGIQEASKRGIEIQKKAVAGEDERIKRLDQLQQAFVEFDIYSDGKVREQFLTANKIDPAKVKQELLKIIQPILQLTPDLDARSAVWRDLGERYKTIMQQAEAENTKKAITQDQNRLTQLQDNLLKKYRESQEKIAQFSSTAFSDKGTLDTLRANAASFRDFTSFEPNSFERYLNLDTDRVRKYRETEQNAKVVANQIAVIEGSLQKIRDNASIVQGQLVPKQEDVAKARSDFELLTVFAQRYVKTLTGRDNYQDFAFKKGDQTFRLGDLLGDTEKQLKTLEDGAKSVDQSQKQIDDLVQSTKNLYIETVQPLIQKFPELAIVGKNAFQQVGEAAKNEFVEIENAIDRITKKLQLLPIPKADGNFQGLNQDVNPAGLIGANAAQYFSDGGYVHPGAPRGTDTIPAWLTPGEFVMPANMTKKFFAQLVDMRKGVAPKYYAQGGLVTNRIGDINIHMESSGQPSATRMARQLGQELRREIRRGTLKLS